MKFSSNDDFYAFVEATQQKLNQEGFIDSAERLFSILRGGYTTLSEIFGEIRLTLQAVAKQNTQRISTALLNDIKIIIDTIDEAFRKANRG